MRLEGSDSKQQDKAERVRANFALTLFVLLILVDCFQDRALCDENGLCSAVRLWVAYAADDVVDGAPRRGIALAGGRRGRGVVAVPRQRRRRKAFEITCCGVEPQL